MAIWLEDRETDRDEFHDRCAELGERFAALAKFYGQAPNDRSRRLPPTS